MTFDDMIHLAVCFLHSLANGTAAAMCVEVVDVLNNNTDNMKDDWHSFQFATHWDSDTSRTNAIRVQQLKTITSIVKGAYRPGLPILDLGCGSGQLEEILLKTIQELTIVGVDSSEHMLTLAQRRLEFFGDRFEIVKEDLGELRTIDLPQTKYQMAVYFTNCAWMRREGFSGWLIAF